MPKSASREAKPLGFRRCPECNVVRHKLLFRTPHSPGFKRCIFCWWNRWALHHVTRSGFDESHESRTRVVHDVAKLGYRPEFHRFWICTTCAAPYEVEEPFETAQLCICRGLREQPKWGRGDYNEKIHLCECCLARILPSGSKFSVWFCEDCKPRIDSFNASYERTVIPTGRHSFMFRGGPDVGRPREDEDTTRHARRFATFLEGMSELIDILVKEHRPKEFRAQLRTLRLPRDKDVRLSYYIGRFAKREPDFTSLTSFDRLTRHFGARLLTRVRIRPTNPQEQRRQQL